jgi:hypothetical protein
VWCYCCHCYPLWYDDDGDDDNDDDGEDNNNDNDDDNYLMLVKGVPSV